MKRVTEKASFKKRSPEWNFWKRLLFVYVWTKEIGGFRIRWFRSCIIYYKHYACSVRDAIVFPLLNSVFLCGRRKRIEYARCGRVLFRKLREKSPFSNISGYMWKEPWGLENRNYNGYQLFQGLLTVRVRVRVRVDINSKPNLTLTLTLTVLYPKTAFFLKKIDHDVALAPVQGPRLTDTRLQ